MEKKSHEIEIGDVIILTLSDFVKFPEGKISLLDNIKNISTKIKKALEGGKVLRFEVDDITEEFIDDEFFELYGEIDEPLPEHTKYTFHHENLNMFEILDESGSAYIWNVE
jgi:hypothetical protein